jgi:hypothetical protein
MDRTNRSEQFGIIFIDTYRTRPKTSLLINRITLFFILNYSYALYIDRMDTFDGSEIKYDPSLIIIYDPYRVKNIKFACASNKSSLRDNVPL